MGKKVITVLLVFAISISLNLSIAGAASKKVNVSVKLQSIECVENNHVGNEWIFESTVNKRELTEGSSVTIAASSSGKISIISKVEESDSIPDIGSKTLIVPVNKLSQNKNTTYASQVTVTENRGRYSGNTAVWRFTYIVVRK